MDSIIDQPTAAGIRGELVDQPTLADSGFFWPERDGVKVLVCRDLESAGFANGFSTRLGGVSPFPSGDLNLAGYDDDTAENIEENRRRFLSVFEGDLKLSTVWQVHGDSIKVVRTAAEADKTDERHDAIISDISGLLVGVKTADCVPILVGDPQSGAYAAVHAGWRGTAASIAAKAVRRMAELYGSRPCEMIAAIGPAATCRRYEVGADVIEAFTELEDSHLYFTPTRNDHALVDLIAANRDQLTACGIEKLRISPFCTIEHTDLFFSYRIEKKKYGKTGRLLSVIGRR
jgi:polyphenol oxidase